MEDIEKYKHPGVSILSELCPIMIQDKTREEWLPWCKKYLKGPTVPVSDIENVVDTDMLAIIGRSNVNNFNFKNLIEESMSQGKGVIEVEDGKVYKDYDFLIFHRVASLLNPQDLEYMIKQIQDDPKAIMVGVEPSFLEPSIRPPKMSDNKKYDSVGSVTVYRAKFYFDVIDDAIEYSRNVRGGLAELSTVIGFMGNKKGYKSIQATRARIVYYD